jgi:hypothetical protein
MLPAVSQVYYEAHLLMILNQLFDDWMPKKLPINESKVIYPHQIKNVSFTDVFATDAESARLAEVLTKEYTDNVERKKLAYVDSPFRSVLVLILPHYLSMKCRVRADTQAVRQLLETELKAGRPLKNEEYVISCHSNGYIAGFTIL